jgi:hypothetical protein
MLFLCLASYPSCAILSHSGLLEVPTTYLGSLDYFPARGPMLPNGCPLGKANANGGGLECALINL